MRWIFALLVVVALASGPVLAAPTPVGPGGEPPEPTPTTTPATPTTTGTTTPPGTTTPASNSSGGGFLESLASGIFGGEIRGEGATAVQHFAYTLVAGIAYTPAPNNRANFYYNPSNGLWDGRWEFRQSTVMPLFWFLAAALFLIYLIADRIPILAEETTAGWERRWFKATLLGYLTPLIAGVWLNFRQGLTVLLLQDMLTTNIEAELGGALVLLAVIALVFADLWAVVTLLVIIAAVVVAIPAAYPWLTILFLLLAAPSRILRLASLVVINAWFILGALTLPIAALIGFGFSIDVTAQFTQANMALSAGQYTDVMIQSVEATLAFAAKFLSIAGGVYLAHRLLGILDAVTPGIRMVPEKGDVREGASVAREQARTGYDRARRPVDTARQAPEYAGRGADRARDAKERARDTGNSLRERISDRFASDGGQSSDTSRSNPDGASAGRRSGGFDGYYDADGEFHRSSDSDSGSGHLSDRIDALSDDTSSTNPDTDDYREP